MRADDILIEQTEHDAAELAVAISLEMFQREGAGDDLAPGIGFSLGLFVAGFQGSQLGVDLVASLAEEGEPIGRASARHRSVSSSGNRSTIVSQLGARCNLWFMNS